MQEFELHDQCARFRACQMALHDLLQVPSFSILFLAGILGAIKGLMSQQIGKLCHIFHEAICSILKT